MFAKKNAGRSPRSFFVDASYWTVKFDTALLSTILPFLLKTVSLWLPAVKVMGVSTVLPEVWKRFVPSIQTSMNFTLEPPRAST
jgi:hypothetical protein